MKEIQLITAAFIFCFDNCKKDELKKETPSCIQQKIEEFSNSSSACKTGKKVYRYKFQNHFAYVFKPGNCGADMISNVYDEDCNLICELGGFIGNEVCNEENFGESATREVLIWED